MREIKFRAKMVDFDGWAHGHYVNYGYNYKPEAGHLCERMIKQSGIERVINRANYKTIS